MNFIELTAYTKKHGSYCVIINIDKIVSMESCWKPNGMIQVEISLVNKKKIMVQENLFTVKNLLKDNKILITNN